MPQVTTKNQKPVFTNLGLMIGVLLAAANTASDGSGTLVTIVAAPTEGCRIEGVLITNAQTTAALSSANVIRFFTTDLAGANPRIMGEKALAAATRSASAVGANAIHTFPFVLVLESGQILKGCMHVYAGVQDQVCLYPFASGF